MKGGKALPEYEATDDDSYAIKRLYPCEKQTMAVFPEGWTYVHTWARIACQWVEKPQMGNDNGMEGKQNKT